MAASDQTASPPALYEQITRRIPGVPVLLWALALAFLFFFLIKQLFLASALNDLSWFEADNGLRLQQVRDLLGGQRWYDTHQYRYGPPAGTVMHWSRLIDAPLAGAMAVLRQILGATRAEQVVLVAWPLLLGCAYLAILVGVLRRLVSNRAAACAVVVAANMLLFHAVFGVGELDHHNVQAILVLSAASSFAFVERWPWAPAVGGLAAALSLAVGLETLPFVALIGVLYGLAWVADRNAAAALVQFAGVLAAGAALAFAAQTAPSAWSMPACDVLSPPWILLTTGGALIACTLAVISPVLVSWPQRLIVAGVGGAVLVGAFVATFPACLEGAYGAVPIEYRALWLGGIAEALSAAAMFEQNPRTTALVLGPTLAAVCAALIGVRRANGPARRLLLMAAVMLSATFVLCLFQIRGIYVGGAFVPLAAGWALDRGFARIMEPGAGRVRAVAILCGAALLFEATWTSAIGLAQASGIIYQRERRDPELMRSCMTDLEALQSLPTSTILGPIDLGAHILFLTRHSMIAAGYHRNVDGIIGGIRAFKGSEADMQDVARRQGADYVAICPPWFRESDRGTFAEALAGGAAVPWLERVDLPTRSLMVWRVLPGDRTN